MADLIKWIRDPESWKEIHAVANAAIFHHRFTAIHPFDDGNGRLARLLMNLILMQHRLPPVIIRVKNRDAYLFALRKADQGDLDEIIDTIADEEINSLELLLKGARGEAIEEFDDIDKEVALLKQKLKHIDDPTVLTHEVQRELFNESILPLLDRVFSKLGQFDEFYSEARIVANGHQVLNQNVSGWNIPPHSTPKQIIEQIRNLAQTSILKIINLQFQWIRFKKTPLQNLDDILDLHLTFEPLKYTVKSPTENVAVERVYRESLTKDEIRDIMSRLCKGRVKAVEKHAGITALG